MRTLISALLIAVLMPIESAATRVKELTSIEGVRENQLIGYGLVVGLAGTGDRRQTVFSAQSLASLLDRMGVKVPPGAIQVSNTAAVIVTTMLPPFPQPGAKIDVSVSAIGDAKSLQGGQLLITPLKAADGQVYASAQGAILIAGYSAAGSGSRQVMNHPTAGRIPSGAIVERGIPLTEVKNEVRLQLRTPDFSTASRITEVINRKFNTDGRPIAYAQNSALISVSIPQTYAGRAVEFISAVETLNVESDRVSRIVISERTGTIALGREIRIAPVSILHGALTVQIETEFHVSQPEPLSQGKTTVVPQAAVAIRDETAKNIALKQGSTVDDLVRALQTIGSTPRDIIAILQSLKAAGALDAEVEII